MNPIPEEHPMSPINPYGETKAAVERLLPWYEKQFGLNSVSLRYFNAAGATTRLGEDHRPETHLIPNVLQAAARPAPRDRPLRHRLPDPRRHLRPRLHPRHRPRRRPPPRPRQDGDRQRRLQPRQRRRLHQPRSNRSRASRHRGRHPRRTKSRRGPATRQNSSPQATRSAPNSAGSRPTPKSRTSSRPPGAGTPTTPRATRRNVFAHGLS